MLRRALDDPIRTAPRECFGGTRRVLAQALVTACRAYSGVLRLLPSAAAASGYSQGTPSVSARYSQGTERVLAQALVTACRAYSGVLRLLPSAAAALCAAVDDAVFDALHERTLAL